MKISTLVLGLVLLLASCAELNKPQVSIDNKSNGKRLFVKIDNCSWFTKVIHAPRLLFGDVMLAIKGKTNAEQLTILTYGDGVRSDRPITINSDSTFSDTINISFTHFQPGGDIPKLFYSKTILKAYLASQEFDTTLYSNKLQYEY